MGQVMELIVFDEARALKMLVGSTDKIGVAQVLSQLAGVRHRQLQHKYLDMLFDKDPRAGANFHELQVELYADFDQVPCVARAGADGCGMLLCRGAGCRDVAQP